MDQVNIGKFIAKIRTKKQMTQKELADRIGVTDRAISNWENGRRMPDISLIKPLCDELEISINELLSGKIIDDNNIKKLTDENLEKILKEYYKMKKHKNIFKTLLCILFGILIYVIIYISLIFSITSIFNNCFTEYEKIVDINKYDKNYYIEKYKGDLNSNLSIFPNEIKAIVNNIEFESNLTIGLFDTEGYIYMKNKLSDNEFQEEIKRLSNISITITNFDNKKYTNKILYDKDSYIYPAYVSSDGFDSVYEYALINEKENTIIYLYISYPNVKTLKYKKYLKKDLKVYLDENTLNKYSIYNHTFDNGKTYIEYDD